MFTNHPAYSDAFEYKLSLGLYRWKERECVAGSGFTAVHSVGTCRKTQYKAPKAQAEPECFSTEAREFCAGLAWPSKGGDAEYASLTAHAAQGAPRTRFIVGEERQQLLDRVVALYPKAKIPSCFDDRGKLQIRRSHIKVKILDTASSGGSGMPWAREHALKGDFHEDMELLVDAVMNQISLSLQLELRDLELPAETLVKIGLCDPVRVFIKNEPTKLAKINSGMSRIIGNVSVQDEVLERLLCSEQNLLESSDPFSSPSKVGISMYDDSFVQRMMIKYADVIPHWTGADVKTWDWSVDQDDLNFEADCRIALAGVPTDSDFARLMRNRFYCAGQTVWTTSDGRMFVIRPTQKTGTYNTSSTNSRLRLMKCLAVTPPGLPQTVITYGDDDLEIWYDGAEERYLELGCTIKPGSVQRTTNGEFEFCSHLWTNGGAKPLNSRKGLMALLFSPYSEERWHQYLFQNRHSDDLDVLIGIVKRSGWLTPCDVDLQAAPLDQ
nr:MAG: putative RNA-dependent RNA polymerase [Sobelivirales sp.]UHS71482.1 MAG: putative RNA-dependent RNA polymerase [Sobelivirales sp.]